ncbi:MAG TPA: hypothetical protein VFH27_08930 [Longimicrobiaceae bacterium]|nr:hypothetical protein [Longimicrobiaceae bacterium]
MSGREIPSDATVSGGNILSMLAAMGPFRKRGEQILLEHGLRDVRVEEWYPLNAYVDSLRTISQKMGPNTLLQIGKQIPNHVPLPPGLDTTEKVLASFGMAFDMNHRGMPTGLITYRMESDSEADITSGTPYPCDFDRGVIQGFFQHLLARRVLVTHDGAAGCKNNGSPTCTNHVRVMT